jgi:hypothetical protein
MNGLNSYPARGIDHLIIEQMAQDAVLEGSAAASEGEPGPIEVLCQAIEGSAEPKFNAEGEAARLSGVALRRVVVPPGMMITVKSAGGDLRVRKVQGDVNLESLRGSLGLADLAGVIRVAQVDGDLRGEGVADLRLMGNCGGDLRCEDAEHLAAESIAGDVRIHNLGDARFGRIRGDLWAEKVRGALQVTRAEGDARLSEIGGAVALKALGGSLRAHALTGGLSAPQVNGDAVLQGPYGAAEPYSLSAHGDVVLNLPGDADAQVSARAEGRIRSDVPLTPSPDGSGAVGATLGQGAARMSLTCGGDLRIILPGARETAGPQVKVALDAPNLGERIRRQVTASLAAAGIAIPSEPGWGAARGRSRPSKPPKPGRSSSAEQRRASGATQEEVVTVLKMVEEGKITAEEAELLLNVLGA